MPTIAQSVSSLVPAGITLAQWLASNNSLNNATSTINAGVTKASGGLDAASQAAIDAQNKALDTQKGLYQTTVDANAPYQATGETGNAQLQSLIKDPTSLTTTPGYQFGLTQGLQGGQRAAAASGTIGNGGTIKAQTRYAVDYAQTKYDDAVNNLLKVTNVGQTANAADQRAGETYGSQVGTGETNIGNFGTKNAEDQAALTLAQAQLNAKNQTLQGNNTSSTLGALGPTIQDVLKKQFPGGSTPNSPQLPLTNDQSNPGFVGPQTPIQPGDAGFVGPVDSGAQIAQAGTEVAPTIAGAAGAGAAGIGAVGAGATAADVAAGAVPELAAGAAAGEAGTAALGGIDAATIAANEAAVGTGAVSSGALATVSSLLTNPITIGIGAAIGAALIWKASQVHPTADTFVKGFQNPFGQKLGNVVDSFDKAIATGQMTKAQATAAYQQTAGLIQSFETDRANFAKKGSKEATVAKQAEQTMVQNFGPNYDKILGKMQQEIAQLPDQAAA